MTEIGSYTFESCSQLQNITLPDSLTTINDGAFKGCSSLLYVSIPNGVTRINPYLFEECTNLRSCLLYTSPSPRD